jgi:deoxyribose-phosphate aldolase
MKSIREMALELFSLDETKLDKCKSEHEVCLRCEKCRENNPDLTQPNLENLNIYIDHTILRADAKKSDVYTLFLSAQKHNFKSICVNPSFVKIVSDFRGVEKTPLICSVIGFPLGASSTEVKIFETKAAIEDGADEIDMVINIGWLLDDEYNNVLDEIKQIATVCHDRKTILKVIIETCLLSKAQICVACLLAKRAGADFVKTSTGFSIAGATVEDITMMRSVVGNRLGVKASGGIKTRNDAIAMLNAGANRLGTSSSEKIVATE